MRGRYVGRRFFGFGIRGYGNGGFVEERGFVYIGRVLYIFVDFFVWE